MKMRNDTRITVRMPELLRARLLIIVQRTRQEHHTKSLNQIILDALNEYEAQFTDHGARAVINMSPGTYHDRLSKLQ